MSPSTILNTTFSLMLFNINLHIVFFSSKMASFFNYFYKVVKKLAVFSVHSRPPHRLRFCWLDASNNRVTYSYIALVYSFALLLPLWDMWKFFFHIYYVHVYFVAKVHVTYSLVCTAPYFKYLGSIGEN